MLSAAVLGNVFASPSVASILSTIRVTAGSKGILLIVKNYTGDRLNFGMALELAKREGIQGMLVIVDDDCALPTSKGITGGRGIVGTVLVHKVAGALASTGSSLKEVFDGAYAAIQSIRTLGVALTTCTLPGVKASSRLSAPHTIEIGMGIHGEPGRENAELPTTNAAKYIANVLVDGTVTALNTAPFSLSKEVAILINNLGALPALEMSVMAKEIVDELRRRDYRPIRIYTGPLMTSLDMNGISLSIMTFSTVPKDTFLSYLDMKVDAPAWVSGSILHYDEAGAILSPPSISSSTKQTKAAVVSAYQVSCDTVVAVAENVCKALIAAEPLLTEYDSQCGDGDCGLVMKKGATQVLHDIEQLYADGVIGQSTVDCAFLCDTIANSISQSMGGTSGALLELCFRSMSSYFVNKV
jgi:dihydroxyacetone kinase